MAVLDKYVNANLAAGKLARPALIGGDKVVEMVATFELAAGDSNGSVFRIAQGLCPNLIPIEILINCDALTSSTDWDLGLYEMGVDGAVVDKDIFMDGADLSGGKAIGSEQNGLADVVMENLVKRLYEHVGETVINHKKGYDLALTANAIGTAAGTITVRARFIQG